MADFNVIQFIVDLAQMCLNNLSTTYQYGGRTNPPSRAELDNLQVLIKTLFGQYL